MQGEREEDAKKRSRMPRMQCRLPSRLLCRASLHMTRLFFSALFFFVVYLQPTEVSLTMKGVTQYTGPGHGVDAHVADRARLHARVYNCTTQLQRVVDNKSFDLVPSHAGEKKNHKCKHQPHTRARMGGLQEIRKGFGSKEHTNCNRLWYHYQDTTATWNSGQTKG